MPSNSFNSTHWYKNALFYGVIVELFKDGNADGIGDFAGLTLKLDYLKELGVTCIWLLPFYPSDRRDNGYDVIDYYNVDSRFGTLGEFKTFVNEAARKNIKVIIDLVVHHTSDQHPWFQDASHNDNSPFRDYYIWTRQVPKGEILESSFPGIEAGVWRFSGDAKQLYYHSFYDFEPDLNIANPQVQEEIERIMDFWMDLGIAGFRMDAATMMFDRKGLVGTEVLNPGEIMERWNKHIKSRNPQGILLGEADVKIEKVPLFFGKGHRMDLLFNFLLNRYLFLAFAKNDATAIYKFMKKLPEPPEDAQWLDFLRNHDELNIEQLDEKDKKTVFKAFAPDDGMTVYGRGIRRRLAPMFNGNLKRLKMAYNLLFSLPGSQMLVYGDEIGMGEELQLSERSAVRIPMQWSSRENADFSDSHPSTLARSILSQGPFRYQVINVAEQEKDTASLLSHIKSLVDLIQNRAQIGFGSHSLVEHSSSEVFAIIYELEDTMVLILTNLSDKSISTDLSQHRYKIDEELFSDSSYAAVTGKQQITLNPFGYRWFLIKKS